MRKSTKRGLIIATSLLLLGCILFAGVMTTLTWDFRKLSTVRYETNTHTISEVFDGISMKTDTADITFRLSDDGVARVECHEEVKANHFVAVQDGTLVIREDSQKAWYDYIGINLGSPRITVYLPEKAYAHLVIKGSTGDIDVPDAFTFKDVDIKLTTGDVTFSASAAGTVAIKASTGKINLKNMAADALSLSASTGKITVSNVTCDGDIALRVSTGKAELDRVTCQNFTSNGSTGDMVLKAVVAAGKMTIERSTGNVRFDGADADELLVTTDTGDVAGSLLTDKVFITDTDTGRVDVPKSVAGGRCEISTDTGNIRITVEQA